MAIGVVLGAVSVLSGLYSAYQQSEAQAAGESAQNRAMAIQQQQLQMDQERLQAEQYKYNEFQNLYGSIEENMANYYRTLSPTVYTSQMSAALTKQFDAASTQLRENMAARGIVGSGVEAGNMAELHSDKALGMAQAEANAPAWVAQQQQQFYSNQALPQQQRLDANINQAYSGVTASNTNLTNLTGNLANTQFNLANQYGQSAVKGIGSGMATLGEAFAEPKPKFDSQTGKALT